MNTMPSRSHSSANSGRSATNPQPTHAESARAATSARSRASRSRYGLAGIGRSAVVDADRFVGLADEHRGLLGPRVQGDRSDVDVVLVAQLPHRVDQPHRCFATVDDGDAAKPPVHRWRAYLTVSNEGSPGASACDAGGAGGGVPTLGP